MLKLQTLKITRSNLQIFLNVLIPLAAFIGLAYLMWIMVVNTGLNFDEGYNLQVPVNLIQHGVYASRTSAGFTLFDPFISTGPVFLLPVTFVFSSFGMSVINARIVSFLFAILLIVSLYVNNWMFRNRLAVVFGLGLLFCVKSSLFRLILILGDGAGIGLVLAGLIGWSAAEKKQSVRFALAAGLLLGISVWAKPSLVMAVGFIVLAIFIALFHERLFSSRRIFLVFSLSACTISAAWFIVSTVITWQTGSIFSGMASRLLEEQFNLGFFKNIQNNFPMLYTTPGLAVIITSIHNLLRNDRHKDYPSAWTAANLLPLLWILWWLVFNRYSVDRHLFPGLIFGIIPITQFFIYPVKKPYQIPLKLVAAVILLIGALPAIRDTGNYFIHLDDQSTAKVDQEQTAGYVSRLPPDAEIMGWGWYMDWDIAFLSGRTFDDLSTRTVVNPDETIYVVVTPTMKNAGVYQRYILPIIDRCAGSLIYQKGLYELYEIHGLCRLKEGE